MEGGLVSCIIPTYKRADMLPRAIDSVLCQTYKNIEVLVVDDNEPGSEESIAVREMLSERYGNVPAVRYISQAKHINGAVARNVGIRSSDAEYIAFLDDDEEWEPTKVEAQVNFLEGNPDVQGVSCYYTDYIKGVPYRRIRPYSSEALQLKVLTNRVMIHTSTFLCRHETLLESGAFNPALLRHQDLQMFVDFMNFGKIEPVKQYLVKNHIDSDINRPNFDKLVAVHSAFFDAVSDTIAKYDIKTQKRIRDAHYFGLAVSALKSRKYAMVVKYLFKIGPSFVAYKDVFERKRSFILESKREK